MAGPPRRGERGATTELVLAFPAFFLLIFLGIQFALWHHASHVALAAAQEGARTVRVSQDVDAGRQQANYYLDHLSPAVLNSRRVDGAINAVGRARIDVWGHAESILPGFSFVIHEHSEGPIETFRGDVGR